MPERRAQHFRQSLHAGVERDLRIGMAPNLMADDLRFRQIFVFFALQRDQAAAEVRSANVHAKHMIAILEQLQRRQLRRPEDAGLVGIVPDWQHFDASVELAHEDVRPSDREFADAAVAKTAADDDTLHISPRLQSKQRLCDLRDILGELFEILPLAAADFELAVKYLEIPKAGLRAGDALHLAIAANHGAKKILTLDKGFVDAGKSLKLPVTCGITT